MASVKSVVSLQQLINANLDFLFSPAKAASDYKTSVCGGGRAAEPSQQQEVI